MEAKNIFITGKKKCGKSTFINRILRDLKINYSGYRTLPYYVDNESRGYYINGYVKCKDNCKPISIKVDEERCLPITESFEVTGTSILEKSIEDENSKVILLDEIGRLESKAENFISAIEDSLNCPKLVIGVLQKCQAGFHKDIIKRKDIKVYDIEGLNEEELEEVYEKIKGIIEIYMKEMRGIK